MSDADIRLDMPEGEYRKAAGVNVSSLKDMLLSPAHFRFNRQEEQLDKHNAALIIGTLVHRARLEPHKFCYVVRPEKWDSWRTKDSQAWRDAQTLPVVTPEEEKDVLRCVEAIEKVELINDLAARGNTEVTAFKRHERTGLTLKGRADLVAVDDEGITWILDLKTVPEEGAAPDAFARKVADLNYHMQAAFYADLFGTNKFIFVAVEKKGYPGVGTYILSPQDIELGRRTNEALLQKLAECYRTQTWPGYTERPILLELPRWKKRKEMEDVE